VFRLKMRVQYPSLESCNPDSPVNKTDRHNIAESGVRHIILIWDEVPTMVEIAIFWLQIHITNGLNFMHRKWHTGNQYMTKSAENRMRSNLELLPVINVKSRPRYISALNKSRPRYISAQKISTLFWCTEWACNWQIIFRFVSIHGHVCFNRWKEHPYIVLQYTPKKKVHESK
jgi:hypothetical protein